MKVKVKVSQLCLILCDPVDYAVCGILQVRILEWVAFPFSRGSSHPRDWTQVSIAGRFFTSWVTREAQEYWSGEHFPSPGGLPNPGIELRSPLQEDSLPAGSQGKPKNTGVGSLSLLQGVFPTQELNPGLLHCRWILYQLSHKGSHGQDKNKPKSTFAPWAEVCCSKAKVDCVVPWPDRISLWK